MVGEIQYVNIKEILSRVARHPMLLDITLEEVIQYTLDFMAIFRLSKFYSDREATVDIKQYRGVLPCGYIAINQVMDLKSKKCLRAMTDTFMPDDNRYKERNELAFKTQGNIIYTSFKEGKVLVSYKGIALDKDGLPLLIDDPLFLDCLELYIKRKKLSILFDMGKVSLNVKKNVDQEYMWRAGQLQAAYTIPSVSEFDSIMRMWGSLMPNKVDFDNGFKNFNREYIRRH